MAIDLTIPGAPAALIALADWLDPKLNNAVNDLHSRLKRTSMSTMEYWTGEAAQGFSRTSNAIAKGIDPVDNYIADASEVFRAYAGQLRRGKDKFADYESEAKRKGIMVNQSIIYPPIVPAPAYTQAGSIAPPPTGRNGECLAPQPDGWYPEVAALLSRIDNDVDAWWENLECWVDEHLVPLIKRVGEFEDLLKFFNLLEKGNEVTFGSVLKTSELKWQRSLNFFEEKAKAAQVQHDSHSQRLRSGNPAVNSSAKDVTKTQLRAERQALASQLRTLRAGTRIIPLAGTVIEVVAGGAEIVGGGSPSSVIVSATASLGAGVVASVFAGPGAPVVATAVAVTFVAVVAGAGARWMWESTVPLDVREAIDAGEWGYVFR